MEQLHGGLWRPITFFSRKFSPAEAKYGAFDRELLPIFCRIKLLRHYLEARPFTAYTDHKPLTSAIGSATERSPRQTRHLSFISVDGRPSICPFRTQDCLAGGPRLLTGRPLIRDVPTPSGVILGVSSFHLNYPVVRVPPQPAGLQAHSPASTSGLPWDSSHPRPSQPRKHGLCLRPARRISQTPDTPLFRPVQCPPVERHVLHPRHQWAPGHSVRRLPQGCVRASKRAKNRPVIPDTFSGEQGANSITSNIALGPDSTRPAPLQIVVHHWVGILWRPLLAPLKYQLPSSVSCNNIQFQHARE